MERIIVDGGWVYRGHRHAWRRGVIVEEAGTHHGTGFVRVQLERRGRERKHPIAEYPAVALLARTRELEAWCQTHGLIDGRDDAAEASWTPTQAEDRAATEPELADLGH